MTTVTTPHERELQEHRHHALRASIRHGHLDGYNGAFSHQGGGCIALEVPFDNGFTVLITDNESPDLSTFGPYVLGLYMVADDELRGPVQMIGEVPMEGLFDKLGELKAIADKRRRTLEQLSSGKAIVLIIENPEDDPTTFTIGNVETIELSSYPASKYAAGERRAGEYDTYPHEMTQLADRLESLPGDGIQAAKHLRMLAGRYHEQKASD